MKSCTKPTLIVLGLMVFVLAACQKDVQVAAQPPLEMEEIANVWIDFPLDGTTFEQHNIPIIAHGYVKNGVFGFQIQIDDETPMNIPWGWHNTNMPFEQMSTDWYPEALGWHTIKVSVLNMADEPASSAEVEVYIEEIGGFEVPVEEQPTPTPTEVPYSRCDLFTPGTTTLTLLDIPLFTTNLTGYIVLDTEVPGLEKEIPGDLDVWEYSALLGGYPSKSCVFQGYSQRIYCVFEEFPETFFGTNQVMEVFVNLCNEPIFVHERVSILKPPCEAGMKEEACNWTGGDWECERPNYNCKCSCP